MYPGNPVITTSIIQATTTNDDAAAGVIGQYASTGVAATAISLTTETPVDLHSISLTAGDYDIQGVGVFKTAATTSVTGTQVGISETAATFGADGSYTRDVFAAVVPGAVEWRDSSTPVFRVSLAETTTIYLVGQSTFTVSTQTAGGVIRWRRVR